jgi:hypothetical protein
MGKSLATVMTLAALVLIAACASREAFEAKLRGWEGRNINDFIAKVGPPSSTFQMPNGNMMYTFSRSAIGTTPVYRTPTQTTVNVVGSTAYANTTGGQVYGGQVYQRSCDVNLTVDQSQTIIAWRYEGNACRARPD